MKSINFLMTLIVNVLFFGTSSAQNTYYIANNGNDNASGTSIKSPWRTLEKVNSSKFHTGDSIMFNCGDVFEGQLKIKGVGLYFGSYGSGAKPVISGKDKIETTWINTGKNIWQVKLPSYRAELTNIFNDNSQLPISRYPNKDTNNGYLNFDTHRGTNILIDNSLDSNSDFTGNEIIIRCEKWRIVKSKVLNHNNNTLTIKNTPGIIRLYNGYGYFFINNKKFINKSGEWAYDSGGQSIYLKSLANPNTMNIYYSAIDTLVTIKNASKIKIKDIDIKYAGKLAVQLKNSSEIVIDSVNILASGGDGITFNNVNNTVIKNSTVSYVNQSGIRTDIKSNNNTFKSNIISNIGNECYAKEKTFVGIDCNSDNSKIINNRIRSTGYAGIISAGKNNLVKNNVVDSACLILDDSGGMYLNGSIRSTDGTVVENNIVTNSIGELYGTTSKYSLSNGIYLDHNSRNITVRNNTVAFVNGNGLFLNVILEGNILYNNTVYKCNGSELMVVNPISALYIIKNNLLVASSKDNSHNLIHIRNTSKEDISAKVGVFTTNLLAGATEENAVLITTRDSKNNNIKTKFTLANWQIKFKNKLSSNSLISTRSNGSITKFFYNPTPLPKLFKLDGLYTDYKNKNYCNELTVVPYSSVVLFKGTDGCN